MSFQIVYTRGGKMKQVDRAGVDHPGHYTAGHPEVIEIIEGWNLGFHLGNAVKYILRAPHKDNMEADLRKAVWYLERLIAAEFPSPATELPDHVYAGEGAGSRSKAEFPDHVYAGEGEKDGNRNR